MANFVQSTMLLRSVPTARTAVASTSRALFSSTARSHADAPAATPAAAEGEQDPEAAPGTEATELPEAPTEATVGATGPRNGYRAWLSGEGSRYRRPLQGKPNWIGDTVSRARPSVAPPASRTSAG